MAVVLADLLPEPRMADLGRGKVQVYGLDITQLSKLLSERADQIGLFLSDKPDMASIISLVPDLAVQLIAMGLRAEGQEGTVKQIPLATQIEILMDIWELSVPDAKKLKARLVELSDVLKSLAAKAQQENPSPSIRPLPAA